MKQYHKIQTIYHRSEEDNFKTMIEGRWSKPEFEYLQHNEWVFTEKVDGTNIRALWDGESLQFKGKSDGAFISPDQMAGYRRAFHLDGPQEGAMYGLLTALFNFNKDGKQLEDVNVCLYGEGYGSGIQNGGNYRKDKSFVLFDVKIGDFWLERDALESIAAQLSIDIVPVVGRGTLHDMVSIVKSRPKSTWGDFESEGLIAKPSVEMFNRYGERIITKLKVRDFPQ